MTDWLREISFLSCGHSVNQHVAIGVCFWCGKKCCARCLQQINELLLCGDCFSKFLEDKHESD